MPTRVLRFESTSDIAHRTRVPLSVLLAANPHKERINTLHGPAFSSLSEDEWLSLGDAPLVGASSPGGRPSDLCPVGMAQTPFGCQWIPPSGQFPSCPDLRSFWNSTAQGCACLPGYQLNTEGKCALAQGSLDISSLPAITPPEPTPLATPPYDPSTLSPSSPTPSSLLPWALGILTLGAIGYALTRTLSTMRHTTVFAYESTRDIASRNRLSSEALVRANPRKPAIWTSSGPAFQSLAEGETLSLGDAPFSLNPLCPPGATAYDPSLHNCVAPLLPSRTCPLGTTPHPTDPTLCIDNVGPNPCPVNTVYDPVSNACQPGGFELCSPGSRYDFSSQECLYSTVPAFSNCPSGFTLSPDGKTCAATAGPICPTGYTFDSASGLCTSSAPRTAPAGKTQPACPTGTSTYDPTLLAGCLAAVGSPSAPCPPGFTFNAQANTCSAIGACPSGQALGPDGWCAPSVAPPPACPPGQQLTPDGCAAPPNNTASYVGVLALLAAAATGLAYLLQKSYAAPEEGW